MFVYLVSKIMLVVTDLKIYFQSCFNLTTYNVLNPQNVLNCHQKCISFLFWSAANWPSFNTVSANRIPDLAFLLAFPKKRPWSFLPNNIRFGQTWVNRACNVHAPIFDRRRILSRIMEMSTRISMDVTRVSHPVSDMHAYY